MNSFSPCYMYCKVCARCLLVFQMDEIKKNLLLFFMYLFILVRILAALYFFFFYCSFHSHSVQFNSFESCMRVDCSWQHFDRNKVTDAKFIANYINLYFKMRAHFTILLTTTTTKNIFITDEKKELTSENS